MIIAGYFEDDSSDELTNDPVFKAVMNKYTLITEENGTGYVIRLKENAILRDKASYLLDELDEITKNNKVDYAVIYGEFMYQAGPWPYERRVVCKVEKPENQMTYMYTFIVTNMESAHF